jgi:hypothetical protein
MRMTLLLAGTFVVTFLVICVLGYLLLPKGRVDPRGASNWLHCSGDGSASVDRTPANLVSDDEVKQRALEEKIARTMHWLRRRTGADQAHANALLPRAHRVPRIAVKTLLIGVILVLAVATFVVVIPALNRLFAWLFEPVVQYVFHLLLPVLLNWEGPPILAVVALAFGIPLAKRFRRPARFRAGLIAVALALATFWPLQYVAGRVEVRFWEYKVFLHGLAFFISACLLSGGLEAMRRASNTPKDDSWEFLN